MKRIASIGIATSLFAGSAFAADLPSRSSAPYYAPPPLFTWTGFYGGINGGVSLGGFTNGGSPYFSNASGGLVGGTIGYNYQSGALVVGLEADLDWADISGSNLPYAGIGGKSTINETNSVRARVGYAYERALFYVTGGWGAGNVEGNVANFRSSPNLIISESHYLNGYAVGLGVEYSITPHISVKGEYLFTGLQPNTYFGGTPNSISSGVNFSSIRAGINYHF